MLAMIQYPAVLRKGRAEIDALTGGRRLPTPDDRPFLPYVEAVMREVLRWSAPVPLGRLFAALMRAYVLSAILTV